jgi:hypothetical protein
MADAAKLLPAELAALVHHVELNRSGWWEKTLERLILASIWLADSNPTLDEIRAMLRAEFGLATSNGKVASIVTSLESRDYIIWLPDSTVRIAEKRRKEFEVEISDAERAGADAKAYFASLVGELCVGVDPEEAWRIFESRFLGPLIRQIGANAYKLVAGEKMTVNQKLLKELQGQFDKKYENPLVELVSRFLDPVNDAVRSYVSRMLHAAFCVEASGLPEDVIKKLNDSVGKPIRFRVFVDTNFLFSLLELHDNPSNSAATELKELIDTLGSNPKIDLYVTPRTIDEAKHSISLAKDRLKGFPGGTNFNDATSRAGFSGLAAKYLAGRRQDGSRLSAEDWFDPYLNNFVPLARSKGVELFNEKLDDYATRQDVVDDIDTVLKIETRRGPRGKTFPMVQHDMILWHLVDDNRPGYVESAVEAKDWILTLDFRLIGFDEHKQKRRGGKVPICLHPTSFIQLLQFWIPRTREFEEAILGSVRLPFLFHDLDSEAERTSLRILKGIGRLEDNDQIPEDAISHVMLNEGLRARLGEEESSDEEAKLIRDALVDELRTQAHTHKGQADDLAHRLEERGGELERLKEISRRKDDTIQTLESRVSAEESKVKNAEEKITSQGNEIAGIKSALETRAGEERRQKSVRRYLALLVLVTIVSGAAGWYGSSFFNALISILGRPVVVGFISVVAFILGHLLLEIKERKCEYLAKFWPFQQVTRLRAWLWGVVIISFVGGVVGNLYASRIERNLNEPIPNEDVAPLESGKAKSATDEK